MDADLAAMADLLRNVPWSAHQLWSRTGDAEAGDRLDRWEAERTRILNAIEGETVYAKARSVCAKHAGPEHEDDQWRPCSAAFAAVHREMGEA